MELLLILIVGGLVVSYAAHCGKAFGGHLGQVVLRRMKSQAEKRCIERQQF